MSGQSATKSVGDVKSCIKSIETNNQMSKGSGSSTPEKKKK